MMWSDRDHHAFGLLSAGLKLLRRSWHTIPARMEVLWSIGATTESRKEDQYKS